MDVKKININQSEQSYGIASDIYDKATDFTKSVASISVVTGTEVTADETLSETYINYIGEAHSNLLYETKKYSVTKGQRFKIKGYCRGTQSVACYAFYNNTEISPDNLVYIYTIKDFIGGSFDGAKQAVIDHFIEIPDGVVMVGVVSVPSEGNNAMYNLVNTKDYVDESYNKATNFTKSVTSIFVVTGTEVTADETMSETYIDSVGEAFSHSLYETKKYSVTKGQRFKIKGYCRGTQSVACYAFYNNTEISHDNLVYIYTIKDFIGGSFDGAKQAVIDHFIEIPEGVVMVAVVSVPSEGNNAMYNLVNIKDYVDAEKNRAIIAEQANANTITNEETRAKAAEQVNTKMIFNAASISVILGSKIEPDEIFESKVINDRNFYTHASYAVRRYTVTSGQKLKIKGSVRGVKGVACYALYTSDEIATSNLFSIYTIGDFAGNEIEGAAKATIEHYIEIPEGVTTLATCSTENENLFMLAYDVKNTKDYVDEKLGKMKYVDCLGDSLTMGATRFGWYEDTLQELLGDEYKVRNWGIGGENSSSIMARQGSDCIKFQEDWILKADGSTTLVMNNDGQDILIRTQKYNNVVSLLLQGAENDSEQKTRVVNPCYINGIECTMTYTQGSAFAKGSWYINRNQIGERDITILVNTPIYFNTCKEMGKSEITVIWMGTNDGDYSDWQTLVDKQIMASNKVSNKKFIIIGLHKIGANSGKTYESLMRNTFGNKFFNIREYACSNMIYDAGITPTEDDLTNMANGICPSSLLYDGTHFNPKSNVAIGKMIYKMIVGLGYI